MLPGSAAGGSDLPVTASNSCSSSCYIRGRMSDLRVVGAGLGRTGTHSLKVALERLLGGPCYHMVEVFKRPADISVWRAAAAKKEPVDWHKLLDG